MINRSFLLAGHAIFTVCGAKSGKHYTYLVTKPDDFTDDYPIWFVSLLTGPDRISDYEYLGCLNGNGKFRTTAESCHPADSLPAQVIAWAIGQVWNGTVLTEGCKIQHEGRCGVCGRTRTTGESLVNEGGLFCLEHLQGGV